MHSDSSTMAFLLAITLATAHAAPPDSILDIINTQAVERIVAARARANHTHRHPPYVRNNELDDDYKDYKDMPRPGHYPVPSGHDYETDIPHERRNRPHANRREGIDIFVRRYNNTLTYPDPEVLASVTGINGRKLLKSSRNALVVTKKEYLKKDWCKTETLFQRIKENGCITRTVINRFCYGQCNSFYIPKVPKKRRNVVIESDDEDQNGAAFKSCAFCKPKKFTWVTVTLRCPQLNPPYRKKRIQRIKSCKCMPVDIK